MDKTDIKEARQKLSEAQNPENVELGGLVREAVELSLGIQDKQGVQFHIERMGSEGLGDAEPADYTPWIGEMAKRLDSLYGELDRREEEYRKHVPPPKIG
jgi:hypothetical protein